VEEVSLLAANESVRLPMEMILRPSVGRVLRVAITCDRGQYNGEMLVETWELLSPLSLTTGDYEAFQKRMGGFCHNSATLSLPHRTSSSDFGQWVSSQLQRKLNLSRVQSGSVGDGATASLVSGGESEWRFGGYAHKEMREERVLIGISAQRSSLSSSPHSVTHSLSSRLCRDGKVVIHVYADDAVMGSTLLDLSRKLLSAN
jgi:hypothetical protein